MNIALLIEAARRAAYAAGEIIREGAQREILQEYKEGGSNLASQVVSEIDRAAEQAIMDHLLPTCKKFDLAILSEETEDDGGRFEKDFFWCTDPLDGTLAFLRKQEGYAVSIALVSKAGTPHLGFIYDPIEEVLYEAIKGQGVYKNQKPWKIESDNDYLTYVSDRPLAETPRADEIEALLKEKAAALGLRGFKEYKGKGLVLNAMRVLENAPACMLKLPKPELGAGSIWDYAASACFFEELNFRVSDFDGQPLELNKKENTFMNHRGTFYATFS